MFKFNPARGRNTGRARAAQRGRGAGLVASVVGSSGSINAGDGPAAAAASPRPGGTGTQACWHSAARAGDRRPGAASPARGSGSLAP
jgi:hypothetical protein